MPLTLRDVFIQDDHRFRRASGGTQDVVIDVLEERSGRQLQGFGDSLSRNAPVPFLDHRLPSHAVGELLEHVRDEDARRTKGGPAVADVGICYNVATYKSCWHSGSSCFYGLG